MVVGGSSKFCLFIHFNIKTVIKKQEIAISKTKITAKKLK